MRPATTQGPSARPRLRRAPRRRRGVPALAAAAASGLLLALFLPGAAVASTRVSYVALGDSYTSGPLIPDQAGHPVGCLRSTRGYPALVAAAIGAPEFTNASCIGATTANMTTAESVTLGTNQPQLNALSASTTLVTIGIGGNDINFASIVIDCATLSFTNPFGAPCEKRYTSGGTDRLAAAIARTAPKVAAV